MEEARRLEDADMRVQELPLSSLSLREDDDGKCDDHHATHTKSSGYALDKEETPESTSMLRRSPIFSPSSTECDRSSSGSSSPSSLSFLFTRFCCDTDRR